MVNEELWIGQQKINELVLENDKIQVTINENFLEVIKGINISIESLQTNIILLMVLVIILILGVLYLSFKIRKLK